MKRGLAELTFHDYVSSCSMLRTQAQCENARALLRGPAGKDAILRRRSLASTGRQAGAAGKYARRITGGDCARGGELRRYNAGIGTGLVTLVSFRC